MSNTIKDLIQSLLNPNKEQLEKLAKHYSVDIGKKPKRLSSNLATKIQSKGDDYKDIYYALDNDISKLKEIDGFDAFHVHQYIVMVNKAKEIKDPAKRSSELSQVYGRIFQDILITLGLVDTEQFNELSAEEKLNLSMSFGQHYFGD
ncbi:MAG: hypothetical protein KKB39_05970 [Nanoarchaeota archaeon]|nr:hypothetical protein [Nanoarchaeota archaeon]